MKTEKYKFHKDLKAYANMKVPIIPFIIPTLQKLMGVLYKREKSDREVEVSHRMIPVSDETEIRVLLYEPANAVKDGPCLIYIHGGGFAFQAAPHHFSLARRLAKSLGYKTFFVDYRLAPKYKFPAAPEDCLAVYKWILSHARELQIDCGKIAVCGDSAGGNLGAVLCLMAKEWGIQLPKAQMLLYPVTDRRMKTDSMKLYTDTPMCNSRDMKKYLQMYIREADAMKISYFSPIEADSLEDLPDAYIEVAQYDCLHDEGVEYANALQQNGVKIELYEIHGAMHGYDIAENSDLVKECMEKRIRFLRAALE